MLDEALRNGQKVLVVGNFVFWFEDKNQVGWSVKVASESETTSRGNTLWKEGTIISKITVELSCCRIQKKTVNM